MAKSRLPFDGEVEAEYSDGYIHSEAEHNDVSHLVEGKNIFYDILNRLLEIKHGKMVRFSVYYDNARYDIDFTKLPDNALPIRYKKMEMDDNGPQAGIARLMKVGFGWQYKDKNGKNQQFVEEL